MVRIHPKWGSPSVKISNPSLDSRSLFAVHLILLFVVPPWPRLQLPPLPHPLPHLPLEALNLELWALMFLESDWSPMELNLYGIGNPPMERSTLPMVKILIGQVRNMSLSQVGHGNISPCLIFSPNDKDKKDHQDRAWKHSLNPRALTYIYELNTNTSNLTIC